MTYFSLRKPDPDPEPEEPDETLDDADGEPGEEPPAAARGPLLTGILGPSAWLNARFGAGTAWAVHILAVWGVGFYGGWVTVALVVVWLIAVAAFIPREHLDRAAAALERRHTPAAPTPETAPVGPSPEAGREAILRLLLDVIGDAHGVHLKTVLAHLQKHGQWGERTVADLRQHLEAHGIPVQPKLKVAGVPTRGVLRTDLEALSPREETPASPGPSPAV